MYRFLATPRWLGLAGLVAALVAAMISLGFWQLDRYRERTAINARIDAAATSAPVPLGRVVAGPGAPFSIEAQWTRVSVTGQFDQANEILARGRTVNGRVGYEVLTPLVQADGTAVLVDRGWIPPAASGARARPEVPPAPAGPVTVIGRLHPSESRGGGVDRSGGDLQVRRVALPQIAAALPYPVHPAYVLADSLADDRLVPVPSRRENAGQNAGYVVQWWLFAALTLAGFGYLVRREARQRAEFDRELRELLV